MSFQKGYLYLVRAENSKRWYIVRQISQKGWIATEFANFNIPTQYIHYQANGKALWHMMGVEEYHAYTSSASMREDMFSILKHGEVL